MNKQSFAFESQANPCNIEFFIKDTQQHQCNHKHNIGERATISRLPQVNKIAQGSHDQGKEAQNAV